MVIYGIHMLSQRHVEIMNFWSVLRIYITATEQDIDEYVAVDNESIGVFQEEI